MKPTIFHIDVNSAYLSWTAVEQLKKGAEQDLRLIPAIIGGDQKARRGVVLAKSLPAKRYGIRTGEPVANAFRKCPNLVMKPPEHTVYREKKQGTDRVSSDIYERNRAGQHRRVLYGFTSIAKYYHSSVDAAFEIKNGIRDKFGFTVNIGISANKLLAKMALDLKSRIKCTHYSQRKSR